MRRAIPFCHQKEYVIIDVFEPCMSFVHAVFLRFGYQTSLIKTTKPADFEDLIVEAIQNNGVAGEILLVDIFEDGLVKRIKDRVGDDKSACIKELNAYGIGGIRFYRYLLYAIIISDLLTLYEIKDSKCWLKEFAEFISTDKNLTYEDFKGFMAMIVRDLKMPANSKPLISHLILAYLKDKGKMAEICCRYLKEKLLDIEKMLNDEKEYHPLRTVVDDRKAIVDYYLKRWANPS